MGPHWGTAGGGHIIIPGKKGEVSAAQTDQGKPSHSLSPPSEQGMLPLLSPPPTPCILHPWTRLKIVTDEWT